MESVNKDHNLKYPVDETCCGKEGEGCVNLSCGCSEGEE